MALHLQKIVVTWSGFAGAPGYSTLFFSGTTIVSSAVPTAFFQTVGPLTPTGTTITIPNNGELIDEETGKMTGTWQSGSGGTSAGATTSSYVPQSGAQIRWDTTSFFNGRRVRGRTFLVPLNLNQYTTGGVILPASITSLQGAANTLISASGGTFGVWHRPVYSTGTGDPVLQKPGVFFPVTTALAVTKPCTLNSRRP